MLANLGDDPAGDQIVAEFERYGVDVRGIEHIARRQKLNFLRDGKPAAY